LAEWGNEKIQENTKKRDGKKPITLLREGLGPERANFCLRGKTRWQLGRRGNDNLKTAGTG